MLRSGLVGGGTAGAALIETALAMPVLALAAWGGLAVAHKAATAVALHASVHEATLIRPGSGVGAMRRVLAAAWPEAVCEERANGAACRMGSEVTIVVDSGVLSQKVQGSACLGGACMVRSLRTHRLALR